VEGAAAADDSDVEMLLPAEVARSLGAHERQRLREAVGEGARAYIVEAGFDLATFDEEYRRLSDALGESGEIVSTQPFVDADAPERVCFRIVYASAEPRVEASARVARLGARLSGMRLSGAGDDEHDDEMVADDSESQPVAPSPSRLVRVPLEEIDELITSARTTFAETLSALELAVAGSASGDERAELESRAAHIRRGFSELEGRLKGLREVSLRATLLRAASAGESVARAAGKSVEFETAGGEVMLDRSLAARVAESLLHLIRNAVDHGVEDAHERRAAGKRERGRISVEALAEEGSVVLRVSDDGRGIDPESVARAAAERGLLPHGAILTGEQALRMIFRPGFSTAERVTLVSGRGVGLDVVERAVKEMGGEVSVRSERGRGTVFEMRLPSN
jgi:two-component system chemotaxis sensor kinase CheA